MNKARFNPKISVGKNVQSLKWYVTKYWATQSIEILTETQ